MKGKNKHQKFSLILPIYNNEDTIQAVLESIFKLDYPRDAYELIIIDDGSKDKSIKIVKSMRPNLNITQNPENLGRIKSRIKGAEIAQHERIMIIDARLELNEDALQQANKFNSNTSLISNAYMDKTRSLDDRILYLIRKKIYSPYWGENFQEVQITKKNFKRISKGTGGFVTNKNLFLKYSSMLKGEAHESDDTKLLYNYILEGQKIIRTQKIKMLYKNRTGLKSLAHLFHRGPKFVDFYISSFLKISIAFVSTAIIAGIGVYLILFYPTIFAACCLLLVAAFGLFCLYLSENFVDFISLILYLPVIVITFTLGVFRGMIIKLVKP